MEVTHEMVSAALHEWKHRIYEQPTYPAMRGAIEAAFAVTASVGETLDDVLVEIEEMGWEIDSLMRWKLGGQERWRVIATRPAWPGTETLARHMEDGESRLAAAIALRDAFAVRRERR